MRILENDDGARVCLGAYDKKYYCGRDLGTDDIPSSDGVCGPDDGPQCESCKRFQEATPPPKGAKNSGRRPGKKWEADEEEGEAFDAAAPEKYRGSLRDDGVPLDVRLAFVRKVYSLMVMQLLLSFSVAYPFIFHPRQTEKFLDRHWWILPACELYMAINNFINMAMFIESCFGGATPFADCYFGMFATFPWNYIFIVTYALVFGVTLGGVSSEYKVPSVCLIFAITAVLVLTLMAYALYTRHDFTGIGAYLWAAGMGLFVVGMVLWWYPCPILEKALAGAGAILLCFQIIYDTQLIFGTAKVVVFGKSAPASSVDWDIDMYAFAAYQLYMDFVNMYMYLLELFGDRKDDDE